jgi:23S rRNA (adenine2503-C2)-methyltransferase
VSGGNLPSAFKKKLDESWEVGRSTIEKTSRGRDGTFKLLLRPYYGEPVETVGMPYEERFSCCVSTQVGCPVGCAFCATEGGSHLAVGEILDQVLTAGETPSRRNAGAGRQDQPRCFHGMRAVAQLRGHAAAVRLTG